MGKTELPIDVIQEYIASLENIYTPDSYDLFLHNCNNFSQDLVMFLVGKDIPESIRTLPEAFLQTPMGQMLRNQIDESMRLMTQAPDAAAGQQAFPGASTSARAATSATRSHRAPAMPTFTQGQAAQKQVAGRVHVVSSSSELDRLLRLAEDRCAVIFFTSATCPPCRSIQPSFDDLAIEAGERAVLIKVDINEAYDIAVQYGIRATPTFTTFLNGQKENHWSGANESQLRNNVQMLLLAAFPQHPHTRLHLPTFQRAITQPVLYQKIPPLDKLLMKIGVVGNSNGLDGLISFVTSRNSKRMAEVPLPNMPSLGATVEAAMKSVPLNNQFAVIDLMRVAAVDPRFSGYLVAENGLRALAALLPLKKDYASVPYNVQVVSLQLACNLFSSPITPDSVEMGNTQLRSAFENMASHCLLAPSPIVRSLAAALVYNMAARVHNARIESRHDRNDMSVTGEVEAALVEAVTSESESREALHALLMALGLLLYGASSDSSIWELCSAMDVRASLKSKSEEAAFKDEALLQEVGEELLAKGACR